MPLVKIARDVTVRANELANVRYRAGFQGSVPAHHLKQIKRKGAGEEIKRDSDEPNEASS
jgi:hypothetical protein